MSLTRYSELTILVTLVAAVLTAGVAGAVTVGDESVPNEGEVGEQLTTEAELTELYTDDSQWEFAATTDLENAEWTAELFRDGEQIDTVEDSGTQIDPIDLDETASDAPDRIVVTVTGDVPAVETYSYEDGQQFPALELLGHDGSEFEIESYSVEQYTADSREARSAIDDARSAIDTASDDGQNVSDAESRYDDAVDHYDDGSFDDAVAAATDAADLVEASSEESEGSGADDSSGDGSGEVSDDADTADAADDTDAADVASEGSDAAADDSEGDDEGSGILTFVLYGLGFVALVAVVGGVLYFKQQRRSPNRDPLG